MSGEGERGRRSRRASQTRILEHLRLAARKGDRTALALALDEMRTLAFTPRYSLKYLALMQHQLPRLVDLLILKQGDRIARQKGWTAPTRPPRSRVRRTPKTATPPPARRRPARRRQSAAEQPSLFPGL